MRFPGLLLVILVAVGCGTPNHDPHTNFGMGFFPPSLDQLAPGSAPVNSVPFTMIVNGTNFGTDAVVFWNGNPQGTRFVSSKQLQVALTDADLMQFGLAQVFVRTGGLNSNTVDFDVTAQ
jgi:outer membrane usher protein FimD/PapC